jgi:serine-type anaerobic sulfatase-maturating enzyme
MVLSPTQVRFGYAKSERLARYCSQSPFKIDCWGECPRNRLIRAPDGELGLNYLCSGLRRFFKRALPEVERIATSIRRQVASVQGHETLFGGSGRLT